MSSLSTQPTADYRIYRTNRYDLFELHDSNRNLDESHVDSISESMEKHGFLPHQHITVDEDGVVIDGQHRLAAARQTGEDVYYSLYSGKYSLDLVLDLNMYSEKWGIEDFVQSYVNRGRSDYQKYKSFYEQYNLPTAVPAYLLRTTTTRVKEGDLSWPEDDTVLHEAATLVQSARAGTRPSVHHKKQFLLAVMDVLEEKEVVDAEELGTKIAEAGQREDFPPQTSKSDYLIKLIETWNYNRPKNSDRYIEIL